MAACPRWISVARRARRGTIGGTGSRKIAQRIEPTRIESRFNIAREYAGGCGPEAAVGAARRLLIMKRYFAVAAMAVTMLASACATGYESSDTSLTGGFTEIRLAPDSWRVLVEG